ELLREQKLDHVRRWIAQGNQVAMAGEGINDAPALAAAQVGIAVAGASDITAEAADVVYLGHSLEKLPKLFEVSRKAVATAWQNIILFAGVVNLAAVGLAATGIIGPLGAAFTHQLSSFFVMLNSLRLLRIERTSPRHWRFAIPPALERAWTRLRDSMDAFDARDLFMRIVDRRRELARPVMLALLALIALNGFYALRPDEAGVIERFGRKI